MRIVVANRKGGSGKTSIAVNLAAGLAKHGRTALVDLDSQGDASAWLDAEELGTSTARALAGAGALGDALRKTVVEDLHIAPAGADLVRVSEATPRDAVERAVRSLGETFEHFVIDCPPSESRIVDSALTLHDARVLIPVDGPAAVRNAERVQRAMRRLGANADVHLVLSRFDGWRLLDRELLTHLEGVALLDTRIRDTVVVRESFAARAPLRAYAPAHAVCRDFADLTTEVLRG